MLVLLRRYRLRRARAFLALLIGSTALAVGLQSTTPAQAFNPGGSGAGGLVRTAGGAVRAAPVAAGVRAAGAGLCSTGVGCVVGGALVVGSVLYATKDSWMPWLEDQFNKARSGETVDRNGCRPTFTAPSSPAAGQFNFAASIPTCSQPPGATTKLYAQASSVQCENGAGLVQDIGSRGWQSDDTVNTASGGTAHWAVNACGSAFNLVKVVFRITAYNTNTGIQESNLFEWVNKRANFKATSTVDCQRPDGGVSQLTATSTEADNGVTIPSCFAANESWIPRGVKVVGPDGTMLDAGLPDPTFDYPNCFTGGRMVCVTTVYVDGYACTASGAPKICTNWYDLKESAPERVDCKFGPYKVPYRQCEPLREAFQPTGPVTTIPQPDGSWYVDIDRDGKPDPKPTPTPTPEPNPSPSPTPAPTPGPSTPPTSGENPDAPPTKPDGDSDPDSRGCFGDAWSLNPVDWVYVPVKCAFLWAFKPKVPLTGRIENVSDAFKGLPPFSFFVSIGSIPGFVPATGCPDWRVKVEKLDQNVVCGSSFTNAVRASRPILAALMITGMFWPFIRSLLYSAVPILSPVPH